MAATVTRDTVNVRAQARCYGDLVASGDRGGRRKSKNMTLCQNSYKPKYLTLVKVQRESSVRDSGQSGLT